MPEKLQQQFHTALGEARYRLFNGLPISRLLVSAAILEGDCLASIQAAVLTTPKEVNTHGE